MQHRKVGVDRVDILAQRQRGRLVGRLFYQQPSGVGGGVVHVIAQGF